MLEPPLSEPAEPALHILDTGKRVCYHYAERQTSPPSMDHSPQHSQKLLTDEQKSSSTYLRGDAPEWDRTLYPESAKAFDEATGV